MTIQTSREGGRLTVSLEGRLDTATAPLPVLTSTMVNTPTPVNLPGLA